MAPRYGPEAIDKCLRLYLKYSGQQFGLIEKEMRKVYPGWSRNYLDTRGQGKNQKEGWIDKYQWEQSLANYLAQKPTATLNNAEKLVREIEDVRGYLATEIKSKGGQVDKERLQLHRDYCNLSIAALTKVEAARDTLGAWVIFWEKLMDWMPDIDFKTAKGLVRFSQEIIAKAEKEFGESENQVESLMNGHKNSDSEPLAGTQA